LRTLALVLIGVLLAAAVLGGVLWIAASRDDPALESR
jgi:hypothetical protein